MAPVTIDRLKDWFNTSSDLSVETAALRFPDNALWQIRDARRDAMREIDSAEVPAAIEALDHPSLTKKAQQMLHTGIFRPLHVTLEEREPIKPIWKRAGRQTFVVSDLHAPEHDPHALDVALQVSRSVDLDRFIIAGDGMDVGSLSSHLPVANRPFRWVEERSEAVKPFIQIRESHPDIPIDYLIGNHEDRVERFLAGQAPQLQGLFSMPYMLGLDDLNFTFPENNRVILANDQLMVKHGDKVRGEAGQSVAAEVRDAGMSVIMGHVHRHAYVPVTKTSQTLGGKQPWVGIELGHLMNPRPSYIPIEKTANWQQGCALITEYDNGVFNVELIPIFNGMGFFRGRMFSSRVKK